MSQDESKKIGNHEETDDVEAHGHGRRVGAPDAAAAAADEGDDDVEAHVKRSQTPRKA